MQTHGHNGVETNLIVVFTLTFIFMIVEAVVGFFSNSLALLADAGHMLSDVLSLGLSVIALFIAKRPKNPRYTFGYYRAEILAALFNGLSLVIISVLIIREAVERFSTEEAVLGTPMLIAAIAGLLVNLYGLYALKEHKHENLNVSSAFFHIAADLLGSIAAIIAGILILITGNPIWDVILSFVITILILISGYKIIRKAIRILMQASPDEMNAEMISDTIRSINRVDDIHDLHLWAIDQKRTLVTAHVVVAEGLCQHDRQDVMREINSRLTNDHKINHSTIQIEYPDDIVQTMNCGC